MKYITLIISLSFLFSMTGLELATKMENRKKPIDTSSKSKMEITKKSGKKRNLVLINKSKDNSTKQMLWFLEPRDDYGIGFLKIEKKGEADFMSMWLPGFKKNRRIQSQNKSDSFMGSDLSYEDMTNRDLDEYTFKILSEEVLCKEDSDEFCYILSSKPKDKYSEYSEHKTWVTKDTYLGVKEESYDNAINNGYSPSKIVFGMISSEFDKNNFDEACNTVRNLSIKYKKFGGVFDWEYFDAPPDEKNPSIWAEKMKQYTRVINK